MTTAHTATIEPLTERERELIELLLASQKLGLTFNIGQAYIPRSYIVEQEKLNKRIAAALAKSGAA